MKITSLFNNSDTMSFLDLVIDYKKLLIMVIINSLNQSLHSMFLYLSFISNDCVSLNYYHGNIKRSENFKLIILGLVASVLIYYLRIFP